MEEANFRSNESKVETGLSAESAQPSWQARELHLQVKTSGMTSAHSLSASELLSKEPTKHDGHGKMLALPDIVTEHPYASITVAAVLALGATTFGRGMIRNLFVSSERAVAGLSAEAESSSLKYLKQLVEGPDVVPLGGKAPVELPRLSAAESWSKWNSAARETPLEWRPSGRSSFNPFEGEENSRYYAYKLACRQLTEGNFAAAKAETAKNIALPRHLSF